jgi:Cu+-exporting ATPase
VGRGAELGVLIKEGEALERADDISTVVFDKTGTLTEGEPKVTDVVALDIERGELLGLAAAVEAGSQHPLAEAVVKAAEESGPDRHEATDFRTVEGKGIVASVDDVDVAVGNRALMDELGTVMENKVSSRMARLEGAGRTVMVVARSGSVLGLIAVSDPVKPSARNAVKALKGMDLKVSMITGDNPDTARAVARRIGIEEVHAGVLPGGKADVVRGMQNEGEVVAFVGDGINDAPALAQADVGIAIGSGTDVAVEAGEVVLVGDDPMDVAAAVQLGRKVMSRIRGNLFWAFAYNTALIPLAAGMLYPWTGWTFRPELGAMAMALSSFSVITLSLMLRGYVPPVKRESGAGPHEPFKASVLS